MGKGAVEKMRRELTARERSRKEEEDNEEKIGRGMERGGEYMPAKTDKGKKWRSGKDRLCICIKRQ